MAEARMITCGDCTRPYETVRKNTKVCGKCRFLQNLVYVGTKHTRKCDLCSERFAPLERGDTTCADCIYQPKKHGETACAYCKNVRPLVRADVGVCHWCARDHKHRPNLIQRLRASQQIRKETVNG